MLMVNINLLLLTPLFKNLVPVFLNFKKLLFFIILLPFVSFFIIIKMLCYFIFLFYYIIYMVYIYLNNYKYVFKLEEPEVDFNNLIFFTIMFNLIFTPKAKAFLLIYNCLKFIFFENNIIFKKYKKINILVFSVIIIIFFLFNFFFIFYVGYSYLSVLSCSKFINKLFFVSYFNNYKSYKSYIQHVFINCFLLDRVWELIISKKIIFEKNKTVELNTKFDLKDFANKVKNINKLIKVCGAEKSDNIFITFFSNKPGKTPHYYFINYSDDMSKNISTNLTSSKEIIVKKSEFLGEVVLKNGFKPNLTGQNKYNYLTPPHSIDKNLGETQNISNINSIRLNEFKTTAYNHLLLNQNEIMLMHDGNNLNLNVTGLTVKDYCGLNNIDCYDSMELFNSFLEDNKELFNTEEGYMQLILAINYLSGNRDIILESTVDPITF